MRTPMRIRTHRVFWFAAALSLLLSANLAAQRPGDAQGAGPRTARAAAPDDLTGYWVSVVTELWRYRMVVPDKGDFVKDRKSTRLNSSHRCISYAVFCLKKKK